VSYLATKIFAGMFSNCSAVRIIYPAEIEKVAGELPGIKECAVIGFPEEERVQVILFVVLRSSQTKSEQDILDTLTGKISNEYMPDSVIFADSLPKNANGRIIRDRLKEFIPDGI
jgi:acyl-coenzyme A synthetase/AMP-(fatty) acid ligase